MLLSATLGAQAQKRIKVIDITVQMPKVGADIIDEDAKVTAIKTDVFGSKNMLGDDKIGDAGVGFFEYDTTGKPVVPAADAKFEAGRDYQMVVSVTNFTDVLFNYKNDKEFTADNTTLKVTVNGEPANIITASGRPLQCELRVTMGGKRNPYLANTKVSAADGEHSGYGYVDLGLPSGTKWATCNVGAAKPEAYGDFYGYGETKTKKEFWEKNFEGYGSSLYNNSKRLGSYAEEDNLYSVSTSMEHKLKPEYDAARQSMGGEWSLPTRMQHKELVENTSAKFIIVNGVKGTLYKRQVYIRSLCGTQDRRGGARPRHGSCLSYCQFPPLYRNVCLRLGQRLPYGQERRGCHLLYVWTWSRRGQHRLPYVPRLLRTRRVRWQGGERRQGVGQGLKERLEEGRQFRRQGHHGQGKGIAEEGQESV